MKGQLRVATLFPEEQALLAKFSELTGMKITDMGELDLERAKEVAKEIDTLLQSEAYEIKDEPVVEETEWVCEVCGYVHKGSNPPEKCPLCGVPANRFYKK